MSTTVAVKTHSELGPSGAHQWMNCPGSVEAQRGMPDDSNVHSQEGTAAHALAEVSFQRDRNPAFWVGEVVEDVTVTEDMAAHVTTYVDVLRDYADGAEIVRIERRLTLPPSVRPPEEGMGGTCDAWFYYGGVNLLRVVDLKFGRGVVVEAEYPGGKPNPQLAYYAVLAWLDLYATSPAKAKAVEEIELVVVQPRAFHADGPIRTFRMTLPVMKEWFREMLEAARRTKVPNAIRRAGDWCRFCKVKLTCQEFSSRALEVAQVTFADVLEDAPLGLASPTGLTPQQLGRILKASQVLEAWISTVQKVALGELEAGRPVTGFALKPKRANREWASEAAVLEFAKKAKVKKADLMAAPELKSPAQVEKVLKTLGLSLPEDLTVRESSGYTLTTDTDPKAVAPSAIPALEELPSRSTNSEN